MICGARTREGKPYCPKHIEHSPYIANLMAEVARREVGLEALEAGNFVDIDDPAMVEIIDYIKRKGAVTLGRLKRDLRLTARQAKTIQRILVKKKLAKVKLTERRQSAIHWNPA